VLAISQSGQTFPTLQATNAFEKLYQSGAIGGLFILTGELNSLMGAAIAQSYAPGAAFSRRIFTNGSGRRSTEPSTVTVAAAQQTLTELLFYLAFRIRQAFPDSSPLGMTLVDISKKQTIVESPIYYNGNLCKKNESTSRTHRKTSLRNYSAIGSRL
jgi:hypothetical protein